MRQQITASLRRLGAVLCLLAYLGTATPLVLVAATLVAVVDGEHGVTMTAEPNGMSLILRHDEFSAPSAPPHSHCLVSQALVLMAEPSTSAEQDHVLSFQSASPSLRREVAAQVFSTLAAAPSGPPLDATLIPRASVSIAEVSLWAIPPPALSVSVVRATIFLI